MGISVEVFTGRANESSVELAIAFIDNGDSGAAERLYHRHRDVTLQLAANRLSPQLRQRVDAEDVYQSVSLILFNGLRNGRFKIRRSGDLRALLAQLIRQRILKKAELHTAAKRTVKREGNTDASESHCADHQKGPAQLAEQRDMITTLLAATQCPRHRLVIRMAIDGAEIPEIAEDSGYCQARVRQILNKLVELAATRGV